MKKIFLIFAIQLIANCVFAKSQVNDNIIRQNLNRLILLNQSQSNQSTQNEIINLTDSLFKSLDKVVDIRLANEVKINLCTTLLKLDKNKIYKPIRIEKLLNSLVLSKGEDFYKSVISKNYYLLHNDYGWHPTIIFDSLATLEKVIYAINYKFYNNQVIDNEFVKNAIKYISQDESVSKNVKENILIKLSTLIRNDSAEIEPVVKKNTYVELSKYLSDENQPFLTLFKSFTEGKDTSFGQNTITKGIPPPSGSLFAGIEVGSSAVKLTIVEFMGTETDGSYIFKLICEPRTIDINSRGMDSNKCRDISNNVRQFYNCLFQDYPGAFDEQDVKNIQIGYSSGFCNNFKKAHNEYFLDYLDNLISKFLNAKDKTITHLSSNDESAYTFLGIIQNRKWWNSSVVIDIGNGNTKGGFYTNNGATKFMPEDFIPVSYDLASGSAKDSIDRQVGITANINTYYSAMTNFIARVKDREIADKIINSNRALTNKKYVFFSGGISWVISTLKKSDNFNFKPVEINEADITDFINSIANDFENVLAKATSDHDDLIKRKKESLQSNNKVKSCLSCGDYDFIFEKFDQKLCIAGAEVLLETMRALKSFGISKRFFVVTTGKVAWTNGFIADQLE